jgi:hypothetical protein
MVVKLTSAFAYGCNTYLKEYKGMNILLKRSCFLTEPSLSAKIIDIPKAIYKWLFWKPIKKFSVLYENGDLSPIWKKGGDIKC